MITRFCPFSTFFAQSMSAKSPKKACNIVYKKVVYFIHKDKPKKVENMARLKLHGKEEKKSLNIKVTVEMDARLKRARKAAREQGVMFNVSEHVENYLNGLLKQAEKQLNITRDIKEDINQGDLFKE